MATSQTTNTVLATRKTTDSDKALRGSQTTYINQLGLGWLCRTLTSACSPEAARCSDVNNGFRWQSRPWTYSWPSVATWPVDVNADAGCRRNTDPHTALSNSIDMDITVTSGGSPGGHISLVLTTTTPPVLPLFTAHTALLILSPISLPHTCLS